MKSELKTESKNKNTLVVASKIAINLNQLLLNNTGSSSGLPLTIRHEIIAVSLLTRFKIKVNQYRGSAFILFIAHLCQFMTFVMIDFDLKLQLLQEFPSSSSFQRNFKVTMSWMH